MEHALCVLLILLDYGLPAAATGDIGGELNADGGTSASSSSSSPPSSSSSSSSSSLSQSPTHQSSQQQRRQQQQQQSSQHPNRNTVGFNIYRELLSNLSDPEDLRFIASGFHRLFSASHYLYTSQNSSSSASFLSVAAVATYSYSHITCDDELLILFWKFILECPCFLDHMMLRQPAALLDIVIIVLNTMLDQRRNECKSNYINLGTFLLLHLSSYRAFAVLLNRPYNMTTSSNDAAAHVPLMLPIPEKTTQTSFYDSSNGSKASISALNSVAVGRGAGVDAEADSGEGEGVTSVEEEEDGDGMEGPTLQPQEESTPSIRLVTSELPFFYGSYADAVILVLHRVIIAAHEGMYSTIHALLSVICNISPYSQGLCSASAMKIVNLAEAFGSLNYLYSTESNYIHLVLALETLNNIIQYQYSSNTNVVYAMLRSESVFKALTRIPYIQQQATPLSSSLSSSSSAATAAPGTTAGAGGGGGDIDGRITRIDPTRIVIPRFKVTKQWHHCMCSQLPLFAILNLLDGLGPQLEAFLLAQNKQNPSKMAESAILQRRKAKQTNSASSSSSAAAATITASVTAVDVDQVLHFIAGTMIVGLLPQPHPIVVRGFHPNPNIEFWLTWYMWGVLCTSFQVREHLSLFDFNSIRLFSVSTIASGIYDDEEEQDEEEEAGEDEADDDEEEEEGGDIVLEEVKQMPAASGEDSSSEEELASDAYYDDEDGEYSVEDEEEGDDSD